MDTRIRRVDNKDKFHETIDDYIIQGYAVKKQTEFHATLKRASYGSGGMHFIWFLFTFWWTMGIGNAVYAWYGYLVKSQKIVIKVNK